MNKYLSLNISAKNSCNITYETYVLFQLFLALKTTTTYSMLETNKFFLCQCVCLRNDWHDVHFMMNCSHESNVQWLQTAHQWSSIQYTASNYSPMIINTICGFKLFTNDHQYNLWLQTIHQWSSIQYTASNYSPMIINTICGFKLFTNDHQYNIRLQTIHQW